MGEAEGNDRNGGEDNTSHVATNHNTAKTLYFVIVLDIERPLATEKLHIVHLCKRGIKGITQITRLNVVKRCNKAV